MEAAEPGEAGRVLWLRGGIVALAVCVGLIAWLSTQDDGDESEPAAYGFEARIVSQEELGEIAASSGHAVYWAGPMTGKALEVSESSDGGIQVSYVDEGGEPGGSGARQLTIGSYPMADASAALEEVAARPGSIVRRAEDGREAVTNAELPTSVYLASPDGSVQIEVYDPSPIRAKRLALSGRVEPID
jgi:hypothetical protein